MEGNYIMLSIQNKISIDLHKIKSESRISFSRLPFKKYVMNAMDVIDTHQFNPNVPSVENSQSS